MNAARRYKHSDFTALLSTFMEAQSYGSSIFKVSSLPPTPPPDLLTASEKLA